MPTSTSTSDKTYKIRKFVNGRRKTGEPFLNYSLTIPVQIAEKLPESIRFTCELTDDGILFKPVTKVEEDTIPLPSWAKGNQN